MHRACQDHPSTPAGWPAAWKGRDVWPLSVLLSGSSRWFCAWGNHGGLGLQLRVSQICIFTALGYLMELEMKGELESVKSNISERKLGWFFPQKLIFVLNAFINDLDNTKYYGKVCRWYWYCRAYTAFASGSESSHWEPQSNKKVKLKRPNTMNYAWHLEALAVCTE